MKTLNKIIWIILAVGIFCGGAALPQDDDPTIPWRLLPRVLKLNETQRSALFNALKSVQNYGTCNDSIFNCLMRETPDKTAVRMTNFGAYLVLKGIPPRTLGILVKERARYAKATRAYKFSYENTPIYGNDRAGVTLTEFAEFKCPYCVPLAPVLKKLVEESKGTVRHMFKHFPSKNRHGTVLASKAAQAAHSQGKFWEMYELLYRDIDKQKMEDIIEYATKLGLDMNRFKNDLEDPKLLKIIKLDKIEGLRARVTATPTLFINGKIYNLRNDEPFLKDIINEEAERLEIEPPFKDWSYR